MHPAISYWTGSLPPAPPTAGNPAAQTAAAADSLGLHRLDRGSGSKHRVGARVHRTIKEATVRRYHHGTHDKLRAHLHPFVGTYNYGRRFKAICGLTPYEAACQSWTKQPERFKVDPSNHTPGQNS